MYHRYFGMKHRPFTATPQTGSCYPAANQEEALATLQYAITQGRGIAILTGTPGTGKTLVCHRLMANLEPAFTTAMITNTHMPTIKGLLQAILYDLSLPFHGLDEQELRLTLTDFLLGKYAGGGRTVLVIDEAQNLAIPLLEELRMLSNLEGECDKLFQIVLAGHPRLLQLIRSPELETLSQRIGARAVLSPLTDEETVAYIQYQLESAGVSWDKVFSYDAICTVHDLAGGVPRLISQLADHALLRAYVTEMRRVDRATVVEAKNDLEQSAEQRSFEPATPQAMRICEPKLALDAAAEPELAIHESPDLTDALTMGEITETAGTFVACTEFQGSLETLQVSTEHGLDPAEMLPMTTESIAKQPGTPRTGMGFVEEEVVFDPYAMMDAARSASLRTMQQTPIVPKDPVSLTSTPNKTQYPAQAPVTTVATSESSTKKNIHATTEAAVAGAIFVESTDNAAVHEVGAGLIDSTNLSTESPILVIENRQQRVVGSHIARVDTPEQQSRDNRGYRRLFTHARKS